MDMDSTALKNFDPRAGIILVTATLYGRVELKVQLVFDTGATYCMLPLAVVKKLGIPISKKRTTQTTTASKVESSPLVDIPVMEVLGQRVENVTTLVRDLPPLAGVDGLLGLSFLKHFKVMIDFEEGELSLDGFMPEPR